MFIAVCLLRAGNGGDARVWEKKEEFLGEEPIAYIETGGKWHRNQSESLAKENKLVTFQVEFEKKSCCKYRSHGEKS